MNRFTGRNLWHTFQLERLMQICCLRGTRYFLMQPHLLTNYLQTVE